MKCRSCKGSGKKTVTVREYGSPRVQTAKINCSVCDGKGEITRQLLNELRKEAALWCLCDSPDMQNMLAHDDGDCGDAQKHHFHCGTCKKIFQIG